MITCEAESIVFRLPLLKIDYRQSLANQILAVLLRG